MNCAPTIHGLGSRSIRAFIQDDRKGSSLLYTAWGVALLHCTFCIFRQQSLKAHPYYPASILAPPDRPASCLTSRLRVMPMRADFAL